LSESTAGRVGPRTYLGLFAVTLTTLTYQILLTRIFSVSMWYHFAFMAISIAMFGLSFGAIIVYFRPEAFEDGVEELDLATAMRMAEERNTALAVEDSVVESTRQDAAIARTFLLPQIRADLLHIQTDAPFAFGPAGLAADGATQGAVTLRQLIYDDPTWSARRAALRLVASSEASPWLLINRRADQSKKLDTRRPDLPGSKV